MTIPEGVGVTPEEYLARVHTLVDAGQWREALAFAETNGDGIVAALSLQELNRLYGTMEMVMNFVEMAESVEPTPLMAPVRAASPLDLDSG